MILSRVIEHLRHRNWTAALLDFVLVVLGVFIGLHAKYRNTERHGWALESQTLSTGGEPFVPR